MAETDTLLEQLQSVLTEIEELEQKAAAASPEDRETIRHALGRLVARKLAIEEEISQATGAAR